MNESRQTRRLTRSRDDRFIGGVAAGVGQYLNIDPVFVRIAFVISLIFGGIGGIVYLALLVSVPIDGDPDEATPPVTGARRNWIIAGAAVLGVLALYLTGESGFAGWFFGFAQGFWFGLMTWALAIVAVTWLLHRARDGEAGRGAAGAASPPPPATAPAAAAAETVTMAAAPTQNAPAGPPRGAAADSPPPPATDAPSSIGKIMTVIAIVMAGIFSALVLAVVSGWTTAVFGALPMGIAVILVGTGAVVAALQERHQLALWTLGAAVAIAVPMAVISLADLRIEGRYGEVRETPVVAGSIPDDGYQLAAGTMTIDMRGYPFQAGQTVDLPLKSGLGATRVIVPDGVCVTGSVNGKAGLAETRGLETSGLDYDRTLEGSYGKSPELEIDSDVKVGLFLVIDDTTFKETGPRGTGNDEWGGTFDDARLQDEAQKRARVACRGNGREEESAETVG